MVTVHVEDLSETQGQALWAVDEEVDGESEEEGAYEGGLDELWCGRIRDAVARGDERFREGMQGRLSRAR